MPKHDTPRSRAQDEGGQARIAFLVQTGLGYGEAQAVEDTANHAVEEALRTMMDIVERNATLLRLSPQAHIAAALVSLKMLEASVGAGVADFVKLRGGGK